MLIMHRDPRGFGKLLGSLIESADFFKAAGEGDEPAIECWRGHSPYVVLPEDTATIVTEGHDVCLVSRCRGYLLYFRREDAYYGVSLYAGIPEAIGDRYRRIFEGLRHGARARTAGWD